MNANLRVYKHLLATYGKKPGYWFGFVTEIIRTLLLRVWIVIILARIASNFASGNIPAARNNIVLFLAVYIGGSIIGSVGELVALLTEDRLYDELGIEQHHRLTSKDMAFYRDHQTGYLVGLFRQYIDNVLLLVRFLRWDVVRSVISLVAPTIVLFFVNWRIGLLTVGVIILQVVYITWASSKTNIYRRLSHEIYRKVTGEVSDQITNITAFKSAGTERTMYQHIKKLIKEETDVFWQRRKLVVVFDLPRELLSACVIAASFWVIISIHVSQSEAVGLIVLSLTYLFQIMRSVGDVSSLITQHDDWVAKIEPTLSYLENNYEEIKDPVQPVKLTIRKGDIAFKNVNFYYESHDHKTIPVFKNLAFEIKGGQRVGIVGLSGAGKSTLANLIMRFDDIKEGSIAIDGMDIRNVRQSHLRRNIAYVPQEPLLFHRTIRENIAYANHAATQREIIQAAKAAYAHDFIMNLPSNYDAMVGERGVKLSGGQKQRIVIARAVLKKAPLMIFDEATSALDTESERIIQKALPQIIGRHTAIIIAHRLSTIAGLDRILVMHKGKIIEDGSHKELLTLKGQYFRLWQKQTEE